MKINRKILMAILLIGAVSCASKNAVGVDQQQNVKYKEIDQQQQLANIRNEILERNLGSIDSDIFVMTIARAKIGSLSNKLNKNSQFTNESNLLSAFQKAIVDSPIIDSIKLSSSTFDINTLNDQINSACLLMSYAYIEGIVNLINSRESGELKIIADLVIALRLFEESLVKLVGEDKRYVNLLGKIDETGKFDKTGKIGALDVAFSKKKIEFQDNALIKMLAEQGKEISELQKKLKALNDKSPIASYNDISEHLDKMNECRQGTMKSHCDDQLLSNFIKAMKSEIDGIQKLYDNSFVDTQDDDSALRNQIILSQVLNITLSHKHQIEMHMMQL